MKRLICSIIIITLAFSLFACSKKNENNADETEGTSVVSVFEGEKITAAEVEFYRKRLKSTVLAEYAGKYKITDFSIFWETEFDGKTPTDELEERALSAAKEAKKILMKCKERGIYDDISFEGLKRKAEQYNAEHESSNATGLKSIDVDNFYEYYVQNGIIALRE